MAAMPEVRQACDRCHSKKLRCTRRNDMERCVRCAKANASCTFSPATKPNRMPQGGDSSSSSSTGGVGFDWFGSYPTANGIEAGLGEPVQGAPTGLASLPELMCTLDGLWHGMPAADVCHISLQDMGQYLQYLAGATFIGSVLDQVLAATQKLQDVYHLAIKDSATAKCDAPSTGCSSDSCMHLQSSTDSASSAEIDFTALTLLVACHLRLLDILGNISKHGSLCLKMANSLPPAERPQFPFPQLQMGSFVMSQDKMAGTIITMTIDQQHSLLKSATQLTESTQCSGPQENSALARMQSMQNAALLERANTTLDAFKKMAEMFADVDLLGTRSL